MNNFNNFLNHLNSFPKNKNQLNELNSSGRHWTPDGPGPDRAPPTNPLAIQYFADETSKANSVSGKPNMQKNQAQQEFLRHIILSHKHAMFEELNKARFNNLPEKERQIKGQQLASAYNAATGEDANEDTLMLAAAHNDPAIREAAHNNVNATDNVKGMALWHDMIQDQTEADLRSKGMDPADLSKHRSHPQIQRLKAKITDRMIELRSHLSTAINNGHNLLELHKQHLRGEDPEKEQRERGDGPYDTPDRMN